MNPIAKALLVLSIVAAATPIRCAAAEAGDTSGSNDPGIAACLERVGASAGTADRAVARCVELLPAGANAPALLMRGDALLQAGQFRSALAVYGAVADDGRAAGNATLVAQGENGAALGLQRLGAHAEAQAGFERAAAAAAQAGDADLAARAYANAAAAALRRTNDMYVAALLARAETAAVQVEDGAGRAFLLAAIGRRYGLLAARDRREDTRASAMRVLAAARDLAHSQADARSESFALGYLAEAHMGAGQRNEALRLARDALALAPDDAGDDLRFRWHWLIGRLLRAEGAPFGAVATQYRAAIDLMQELRPQLRRAASTAADPDGGNYGRIYLEYADLLLAGAGGDDDRSLRNARDALELVKATELEDYFQDDCVATLHARTAGVDQVDAHTVVLYPMVFDDRLELLASIGTRLQRVTVPIPRKALTARIKEFRRLLEKRTTRQYLPHAQALYTLLFAPIQPAIDAAAADTIVVVPDDVLRLFPMAALHDGERFLAERYALAVTPGMTLTDPGPLGKVPGQALLAGLTAPVQGFVALPAVADELEGVAHEYAATRIQDDEFNTDTFAERMSDHPFSIVHIASHAQFGRDALDTFILAHDGRIGMNQLEQIIGARRYLEQPIDLLTLSACQTAAGDERAALGLAGVAVKAGARSALASLWSINDPSSSMLVQAFYRALNAGNSKAQALRQAQQVLLADGRYRHPGYWAPFILIGNWL